MPTSFWNDHNGSGQFPFDLPALRERYIEDGRRAAERLQHSEEVLAVWLSGPFDFARVRTGSDLHMTVLLRGGNETYYHHQFPPFSEVGRRLEIAFFPLSYFRSALENGLSQWPVVFDLHKLRETEVLFEREGILSRLTDHLDSLEPARLFIGRQINALRGEAALMGRFLSESKLLDCVASSRHVTMQSLLLLLVDRGLVFSKTSHVCTELRSRLPRETAELFERAEGIHGTGREAAEQAVQLARVIVSSVFERW